MAVPNIHANVANALDDGITSALAVYQTATKVVALSGEAASYAEATTDFGSGAGKRLGSATISGSDFTQTGTGLSAKVRFGGKAGGTCHVAGNPSVIAFLNEGSSTIVAQLVENGANSLSLTETVTFPAFDLIGFGSLT